MARIEPQLRANEDVLWQGQPVRRAFIVSYGLLPASIPALFFLLGFVFVYYGNILFDDVVSLVVFSLGFVVMPLGMLFGIIAWSFLACENTEYLISDQRLITRTGAIGLETRLIDLDKIQEVYVVVGTLGKIFGTGSIEAPTAGVDLTGRPQGSRWASTYSPYPKLVALKKPYEVQKLLQETIRKVRQAEG